MHESDDENDVKKISIYNKKTNEVGMTRL